MNGKREVWVDYVKVLACILVVLGHFFQSMVKANVLPENSLYTWFNTTIYYFHVPLFFICSGYLYQRYSRVDSWKSWMNNVIKKAVTLGIPYFVFSFVTWLLKTVFSGSVNDEASGLLDTIFIHPASPYWYLYTLFFIFLITPTIKNRLGIYIFLGLSLILKLYSIVGGTVAPLNIYVISRFCQNEIWFVFGLIISVLGIQRIQKPVIGLVLGLCFLGLSVVTYRIDNEYVGYGMGIIACMSVLMISSSAKRIKAFDWLARYTMPVFLMHTIFAAPMRVLLLRLGVDNVVVHVFTGIIISFLGPILAMAIFAKIKLDWIVYPRTIVYKRNNSI